ncbi:MAG: hypothetical protein C6P37_15790 [Caldibacillus debilis]|uniref:Uncharacterized protein n=1 Tax=Caldibacillus debilis TaxID=301148 RepID=A0A3E0JXU7_9BACI|nr:MAG: hypothetical protein C6P37_15790 [Caldibacillus debilis]
MEKRGRTFLLLLKAIRKNFDAVHRKTHLRFRPAASFMAILPPGGIRPAKPKQETGSVAKGMPRHPNR